MTYDKATWSRYLTPAEMPWPTQEPHVAAMWGADQTGAEIGLEVRTCKSCLMGRCPMTSSRADLDCVVGSVPTVAAYGIVTIRGPEIDDPKPPDHVPRPLGPSIWGSAVCSRHLGPVEVGGEVEARVGGLVVGLLPGDLGRYGTSCIKV